MQPYDAILRELMECREEDYAAFAASLLPEGEREGLLGVLLPILRTIARRIAKGDWRAYLRGAPDESFEEILLQGMVIDYAKAPVEELLPCAAAFVPKITNWSLCDSFCIGLKIARERPEEVWAFLQPYFHGQREFEVRFAVVMLLDFFLPSHLEEGLCLLDGIRHDGYYVKMAVAWAVSVCFTVDEPATMAFLLKNHLDDFTYNKALQKITESFKVDKQTKEKIRAMKRRGEES